jgi:hypothetical protein
MQSIRDAAILVTIAVLLGSSIASAQPPAARNFVAHLDGGEEVPARETQAVGQAILHVNDDETELTFEVIATNIDNIIASHIHLGVFGVNGPVVAFLAGPFPEGGGRHDGILNQGTITAANLVGPLAGMSLSVLIAAMRADGTYVNVHTNDGVDGINTGPGDFPMGEIRGQIRAVGP